MPMRKSQRREVVYPVLTLIIALLVWELSVAVFKIHPFLLPSVSSIGSSFASRWEWILYNTWVTFYEVIVGFGAAVAVGVMLGFLIYRFLLLRTTLYPFLITIHSLPKIALAPLLVVWIGLGLLLNSMMAFLLAVFSIILNTYVGLTELDPDLERLGRHLSSSEWDMFVKIRLPNAYPYMFAGAKIGVGAAVIGAIIGEFMGGNEGLGFVILLQSHNLVLSDVFASLAMLAAMALGLFGLIVLIERKTIPWHAA